MDEFDCGWNKFLLFLVLMSEFRIFFEVISIIDSEHGYRIYLYILNH